ncbi:MAG: DUF86 domain-containing protein [Phycisphaera sp.]|nr:DUF86 domain-containing protein [Phycisphaera sp.]
MQPETAKLLSDIRDAAERIARYTQGLTRDDYLADGALRDAVHWNFAVVGEALSQLYKHDPATARSVPEWQRIIAFRNQLVHGYGVIKNEITWDIIVTKLPVLRTAIEDLLREG